mmetsp:Transcript_9712/g.14639  ORF Transcript_9712/g.14639 Transcript_9712/m.14639 type:complete len:374 (+) Transcript_9712:133-1254(+)|eukprot:CAMPEP_0185033192 /NCGR_PEP_ID=MMETSP1103-20130426/21952_1 /TAXON_ID=36769 /ORGANISM="Paraphysomonas bandaiensis, Strain Caron Lab Isolate" /LENGTH=373 /DNA_ID=CAMNT_0027569387 /DNA_START=77 /DNA_END=1198 /DNA_ORIENTATION=-
MEEGSITIKVTYDKVTRRTAVQIDKDNAFNQLRNLSVKLFPELNDVYFDFEWIDDDEERITISSNLEANEAIRVMSSASKGYVKLYITNIRDLDFGDHNSGVSESSSIVCNASSRMEATIVRAVYFPCESLHCIEVYSVRNTGQFTWPRGCRLESSDETDSPLPPVKKILPSLRPDEECDVAICITSPLSPGRYSRSYQILTPTSIALCDSLHISMDILPPTPPTSPASPPPEVSQDCDDDTPTVPEPNFPSRVTSDRSTTSDLNPFRYVFVDASTGFLTSVEDVVGDLDTPVEVNDDLNRAEDDEDTLMKMKHPESRWKEELSLLRSMGFTAPTETIIPLLVHHLSVPSAHSHQKMEGVIDVLLAQEAATSV